MDRNDPSHEEERERGEDRTPADEQPNRFFWFSGWLPGTDASQEFVLA